jgi:hypothetical protein
MTINISPAARALTAFNRVYGRGADRAPFRAAKAEFFRNGGRVNVYAPGASPSDEPVAQYREVRFGKREYIA